MRYLQLAVGLLVSLAALYFAFRGVDIGSVRRAFLQANYAWLCVSVGLLILSILLRARRWQALFPRSDRLHFGRLFGVLNVGYLVNNLLPLRAGEIVGAVLIGEVEDVGKAEALGTIVVERVVDTLGVIVLLIAAMLMLHVTGIATRPVLILTVVLVILLAVMSFATARRANALNVIARFLGLLPERLRVPALRQAELALSGLASLSDPRAALQVSGLTVVVYLTLVACMQAQLLAFHLRLPPAGPFFCSEQRPSVLLSQLLPAPSGSGRAS